MSFILSLLLSLFFFVAKIYFIVCWFVPVDIFALSIHLTFWLITYFVYFEQSCYKIGGTCSYIWVHVRECGF